MATKMVTPMIKPQKWLLQWLDHWHGGFDHQVAIPIAQPPTLTTKVAFCFGKIFLHLFIKDFTVKGKYFIYLSKKKKKENILQIWPHFTWKQTPQWKKIFSKKYFTSKILRREKLGKNIMKFLTSLHNSSRRNERTLGILLGWVCFRHGERLCLGCGGWCGGYFKSWH